MDITKLLTLEQQLIRQNQINVINKVQHISALRDLVLCLHSSKITLEVLLELKEETVELEFKRTMEKKKLENVKDIESLRKLTLVLLDCYYVLTTKAKAEMLNKLKGDLQND